MYKRQGLELGQLQGAVAYPTGRLAPQIDTLVNVGILPEPPATDAWPALDDEAASLDARARTYLHVNCSSCHRPEGTGRGPWDFRRQASSAALGLCGQPESGTLGLSDAQIIAPGDPGNSVLLARMNDRGALAMPPIASDVVDPEGVAVLSEWITSLSGCP